MTLCLTCVGACDRGNYLGQQKCPHPSGWLSASDAEAASDVGRQIKALQERQASLHARLTAALPVLAQWMTDHGYALDVPCGLTYRSTATNSSGWLYQCVAAYDGQAVFSHDCELHDPWSADSKELWVPLAALTDPDSAIFLDALAGEGFFRKAKKTRRQTKASSVPR